MEEEAEKAKEIVIKRNYRRHMNGFWWIKIRTELC